MATKKMEFSEDGYYPDFDPGKARHVFSVRGWCNYNDETSPADDSIGCWTGQRCPGSCCLGPDHDKSHISRENLVVAIHGATRGDGWEHSRYMGIGVYFGEENPFNDSFYIEFIDKQPLSSANQRAETVAAITALQKTCEVQIELLKYKIDRQANTPPKGLEHPLTRIIVKTDSDYIMKSMNDWLQKRRDTEYLTGKGKSIINKDVLVTLDGWACLLEKAMVQVIFWHVSLEKNTFAEDLANEALDRAA